MRDGQARLLLGSFGLVLICWLASPFLAGRLPQAAVHPEGRLSFDGTRALRTAREYVTNYPGRVMGSMEARQSTGLFKDMLAPLGYEIDYMHFDATIEGRRQVGRNVLALRKGRLPQTLVVTAHYDTARPTVQGASDNGAGVAVLLELARVFAGESPRHSILFVATDGEEWGYLGAAELARNYKDRRNLIAALTLDGVAPGILSGFRLGTTGLAMGYSPPWLRGMARQAVQPEGLEILEPAGFEEHFDRALALPVSEQGALLAAGIPAVNLGSFPSDAALYARTVHTAADTIDSMTPDSVERFGRAAERLLRLMDAAEPGPDDAMGAFQVVKGKYLSPSLVQLLHIITFLPFLLVVRGHWQKYNDALDLNLIRWEAVSFLAAWGPFLAAYGGIGFFSRLGLLPRFELFPPPPQDPVMQEPSWGIVGAIVLVGVIAAGICCLAGWLATRKVPKPDFNASKLILLVLLTAVLVLSFLGNSYWTVVFLVVPALVWSLVQAGESTGARAANRILILAAALPCCLMQMSFAGASGLGWKAVWFQVMALDSGLFSFNRYCLATAAAALGIRFLAVQSSPTSARR